MKRLPEILIVVACALTTAGCEDRGQKSAAAAKGDVEKLVELTNKDVAEVERGLPEGAKKLAALLAKELGNDGDPKANAPAVRSSLLKMRQQVPDLGIAKSTFFVFADPKGIGIRNDYETDTMGGKDLLAAWPGLKPVVDGAASWASGNGALSTAATQGHEKEWVAAVPVKKADGTVQGLLLTGWTYRRFAYHLQVTVLRDHQDRLMRTNDKGKMPILYVCLFDKEHVYGAASPGAIPVPEVNEKALTDLGLHAKTASGPASSPIKITDRDFGWAAARLPKLGDDVGVVVLRSEF